MFNLINQFEGGKYEKIIRSDTKNWNCSGSSIR